MFIAAPFTIAKTQKPKCPLTDEWINKIWRVCVCVCVCVSVCDGILLRHKKCDLVICDNMDGPRRLSEIIKDKNHIVSLTCRI